MSIALTGNDLTFAQLYAVVLEYEAVEIAADAVARMNASRAVVEKLLAEGHTAYGINTGFGKLASVRISAEQVRELQVNLVRSHSCGVGAPLSRGRNARDDSVARKRTGEGIERRAAGGGGNAVCDVE